MADLESDLGIEIHQSPMSRTVEATFRTIISQHNLAVQLHLDGEHTKQEEAWRKYTESLASVLKATMHENFNFDPNYREENTRALNGTVLRSLAEPRLLRMCYSDEELDLAVFRILNNMALHRMQAGDLRKARDLLQVAKTLAPKYDNSSPRSDDLTVAMMAVYFTDGLVISLQETCSPLTDEEAAEAVECFMMAYNLGLDGGVPRKGFYFFMAEILSALGNILLRLGNIEEAIASFDLASFSYDAKLRDSIEMLVIDSASAPAA